MNEISFQAVQFTPRLISVIILLSLTWFVAKFSQYMVLRAASQGKNGPATTGFSKTIANISFWAMIALFSPFVLGAAGLDAAWISKVQSLQGRLFSSWPIWMLVSLFLAAVSYLVRTVPKFYLQLKRSPGTSPKELQG